MMAIAVVHGLLFGGVFLDTTRTASDPFLFPSQHYLSTITHRKKKETEQKVRNTKATLKDVTILESVETNVRADQFGREKAEKATRTSTKNSLKDVVITDTVEGDVRREQHSREKDWVATGRQQKQNNTNFDMARALFN